MIAVADRIRSPHPPVAPGSSTTPPDPPVAAANARTSAAREVGARSRKPYPGGKAGEGVYQFLVNQIPPHTLYVEAFLGNGAVLRNKRPALASIGIDADAAALALWRGDEVPALALIQADAVGFLASADLPPTAFVYCDPPYLLEKRAAGERIYREEFCTPAEHARLLAVLKSLPCPVMLSGYWSELYARELAGWRTATYRVPTRGGWAASEWVWMSYPEPRELHDYRHLGSDYRQRENIRRQQARWRRRLAAMPRLRYLAMRAVIEEMDRPGAHGESGAAAAPPETPRAAASGGSGGEDLEPSPEPPRAAAVGIGRPGEGDGGPGATGAAGGEDLEK